MTNLVSSGADTVDWVDVEKLEVKDRRAPGGIMHWQIDVRTSLIDAAEMAFQDADRLAEPFETYGKIEIVTASQLKESEGSTPSVADLMIQLRQRPWAPSFGSTLRSLNTVRNQQFEQTR